MEFWAELWAMPQAVVWEQARSERTVAAYCRWQIGCPGGQNGGRGVVRVGWRCRWLGKQALTSGFA